MVICNSLLNLSIFVFLVSIYRVSIEVQRVEAVLCSDIWGTLTLQQFWGCSSRGNNSIEDKDK